MEGSDTVKGLITAIRTLTVFPWQGEESKNLSDSLVWFPVVGLFLGVTLYGVGRLCSFLSFGNWPAGVAIIIVGAEVVFTRALHLDGLADWADSLGHFEKETRLKIMKDSNLGAFGVLSLVLILTTKWVAYGRLLDSGSLIWILLAFVLSRAMMVGLITGLPYCRAEQGTATPFVTGALPKHLVISRIISLGMCLPFGWPGLALFGITEALARLFKNYFYRRFGGITGDLLGASAEIGGTSLLIICAFPGEHLLSYSGWGLVIS